ncbi:flagellar biosynthesis repressor FlbT [Roseivivax isoporae]|uniref:Flagellum biosynthesis protein FlbT n=1 Tax=Roseivivax isoporae LMG 25204 TaxID=1449351 RepID=X7F7X2_9RHOB|nr:flagellar biosynthesis repressor FlbT [Roseivivax isoporae]ETX28900.1 hypothetical protein RISW2_04095 [Roseivivax isoporae LMG 25204]
MPLSLTLRPNERLVVNGCAIRNSNRRHTILIESRADVVRSSDLLEESSANTPVTRVYFKIQTALIYAKMRDDLVPLIQRGLAELATVFGGASLSAIFEAANYVSQANYYMALAELRPVIEHEAKLLEKIAHKTGEDAGSIPSEAAGIAAE